MSLARVARPLTILRASPQLWGYLLASDIAAFCQEVLSLAAETGRRGRLIYQEPPPSGGGISGGNLETNGFKLRSGCSLEGCGEWNHESRSFKLPRKVHSSRAISERAALSALSDAEGDCATGSREIPSPSLRNNLRLLSPSFHCSTTTHWPLEAGSMVTGARSIGRRMLSTYLTRQG